MSVKSWFEDFDRRYNQPEINKVTVGFSGIDPSRKDTSELEARVSELERQLNQGSSDNPDDDDNGLNEILDAILFNS